LKIVVEFEVITAVTKSSKILERKSEVSEEYMLLSSGSVRQRERLLFGLRFDPESMVNAATS
jgi:hypothetical protein